MKVGLEFGEDLEITIYDNNRVVGHLNLGLKAASGAGIRATNKAESSRASEPAAKKTRKPRKPMSPEVRAKMAAAQKLRWDKKRGGSNAESSDSGQD